MSILGDPPANDNTNSGTPASAPEGGTPAPEATPAAPEATPAAPEAAPVDKGQPAAPETYADFAIPKDIKLSDELLNKFSTVAKGHKLSQEGAQGLVDLAVENTQALVAAQDAAFSDQRDAWVSSLKSDRDFGGAKFNETTERANRTLAKYGSPELVTLLQQGYGDNPEIIKMLARIDKAMGEEVIAEGKPSVGAKKSQAEVLFGDMANK